MFVRAPQGAAVQRLLLTQSKGLLMALHFRKRMYIPAVASDGILGIVADGEALPIVDFGARVEFSANRSEHAYGLNELHTQVLSERVACVLDFTRGAFDRYDSVAEAWHYTSGGKITIKGGVEFSDEATLADVTGGTTLVWGTFSQAIIKKSSTGVLNLRIAIGSGTNSADLLLFYGVSSNVAYEGGLNLNLTARHDVHFSAAEKTAIAGEDSFLPLSLPATFWFCGVGMQMLYPLAYRQRAAV